MKQPDIGSPLKVELENLSSKPQKAWVTVGLPASLMGNWRSDGALAVVPGNDRELHLLVAMNGLERRRISVQQADAQPPKPFTLAEWVGDELMRLMPEFQLVDLDNPKQRFKSLPMVLLVPGTPPDQVPEAFFEIKETDPARWIVHFRTRLKGVPVFVEAWHYIYSQQEVVPWEIRVSYGSTASGEPLTRSFGSLSVIFGEMPVVDYRVRKGLHEPVWRPDIQPPNIVWEAELAVPQQWFRNRTIEVTGALLCLPPAARFLSAINDPRSKNLEARKEAPIVGIADVWQGRNLSFGVVPQVPLTGTLASSERARMMVALNTYGSELDTRPNAQPPNSGQTGEQDDFGASRTQLAATAVEPWSVYWYRYCVQAWMLRPYATREPKGAPMNSVDHLQARTYNLRPDERFSAADMMGWPNPVPYFEQWSTSDQQHRSDNLLYGMAALTRSRSILRTVTDMLELQKLDLGRTAPTPTLGSGMGSPRGWGRPLIALCHAYASGFKDAGVLAMEIVKRGYQSASYRSLPSAAKIRVFSDNESKYGWVNTDGTDIRAWLPWQESIAVMGFYAAYRMFGMPEAFELCRVASKTIANYGWVQQGNAFYCCYAVRWREDQPGEPLPSSDYNLNEPNFDVFVYGIHRWVLPSLAILNAIDPTSPEAQRARDILAFFGAPQNWDDSCWRAVV